MKKLFYIFFLLLLSNPCSYLSAQTGMVKVKNHQFIIDNKPYYFIGANYWYGGLISNNEKGRQRVKKELDFLINKGVNNLRVMVGAEGSGLINGVIRVAPPLQPTQGKFNKDLLKGLDFLLVEMGKRKMKAVLFLSNNWEWSGGFLQYLNWNGLLEDSIMKRKLNWDEMRDYTSKFYSCQTCQDTYHEQIRLVVERTNSITHKQYKDDNAIMSWELANEPRPMRPVAIPSYIKWISNTASFIRSIDKNHLITTGCEGEMGTENIETFEAIHAFKNIDYATIHIWPKNWSWFTDTAIAESMSKILLNTESYINKHETIANKLGKPLVLEEFGLPRDGHSFSLSSPVTLRNKYYSSIFNKWAKQAKQNGVWAGCNFWTFSGTGRPAEDSIWWKDGDDFLGDPPQEEQGLNSVFDSDSNTWNIIEEFSKQVNH